MLQVSKRSKRLLAFLVGFMMVVSQSSYLSLDKVYAETENPGTTETVFALTDTLEAGQNYIVASGDSDSVSILERDSKDITAAKTEVASDGNVPYIKAPSDGTVWTAVKGDESGALLVNGDYAIGLDENGELTLGKGSEETSIWTYDGDDQYLATGSGDSPTYMIFAKGFEASDDGDEVYLYVETEIETGVDEDANSERGPPQVAEDDSATIEEDTPSETDSDKEVTEATEEQPAVGVEKPAAKAEEQTTEDKQPAVKAGAKASGVSVLAFTSDVHNKSGNASATRLGNWIDAVYADYGQINCMGFCGDMANAGAQNSETYWSLAKTAIDTVDAKKTAGELLKACFTTGNHEYNPGGFTPTLNDYAKRFIIDGEGDEGTNYRLYCLGSASGDGTGSYTQDQVDDLTAYLNRVGSAKPIVIITHFPLHAYSWRTISNADLVINALNNAAENNNQKIIFIWGHNHSQGDGHYDQIYKPGDSISYTSSASATLKFYYAAAGCMSDSENSPSQNVLGKGLVLTIDNSNKLSFTYHKANGDTVSGGTYTEQDPVAVTGVTINKPNPATVEVGRNLQLGVTIEPSNATNKSVTWSSSDEEVATVDANGKVKGVSEGPVTITATSNDTTNRAGLSDSIEVTVVPRTSSTYYVLTDELNADSNYLIVSAKTAGNAFAVTNNGSSSGGTAMGSTGVEIVNGDINNDGTNELYIDTDDSKLIWATTVNGNGVNLKNNDGFLGGKSGTAGIFNPMAYEDRYWTYSNEYLVYKGDSTSYNYELYYSNGFTGRSFASSGSPQNHIYLFEETAVGTAPVSGVILNKSELELAQGASETLVATVQPSNAANKKVTWASSNPECATVKNGKVTAVAPGTTTITVTTEEGPYTAQCAVTVTEEKTVDYVLTDTLKAGQEYLIANGKTGSVYIVSNEAGSAARQLKGVSANVSDGKITLTEAVAANTAFTCYLEDENNENSTRLKIGDQDLYTNNSDGLRMFTMTTSEADKHWHYKGDDKNLLWFFKDTSSSDGYTDTSGTYKYYLECSNDGIFTDNHVTSPSLANSDLPKMYLFVKKVPVTGITVDPATKAIAIGEETQLTATIAPEDASIQDVTWSSSDTSVATVDSAGKVTGVAEGSARITATTVDGGKTAYCDVTVSEVHVIDVSLNKETAAVEIGKSTELKATITPENATNKNITWTSSNPDVATVEEGVVTGVTEGTAVITVTTEDGNKTAQCRVTVTQPVVRPGYVIVIDGYALSNEPEEDNFHPEGTNEANKYYGLKGVEYIGDITENPTENILWTLTEHEDGYYIQSVENGKYLNAIYKSDEPYEGHLNLDDTPDVWLLDGTLEDWILDGSYLQSTNASTTSKELCLAYETVGHNSSSIHLFTVRSRSNADSSELTSPDITAEIRYEETDTLRDGEEYIIAATKEDGSVYAVKNVATGSSSTNTGSVTLDVLEDGTDTAHIITSDTGVPWKYTTNNQYMTNGSFYLYLYSNGNYVPRATTRSTNAQAVSYSNGQFRIGSRYLTCNNGTFGSSTTSGTTIRIFEKRSIVLYAIKWIGANGAVLETDELARGDMPEYKGATPVKADDEDYTYNFIGWTPEISEVTGLAVYTAQFEAVPKDKGHTVTFLDENGEVIATRNVADGTEWGEFDKPEAPEKTGYTFKEWFGAPETVTEDISVTASYTINQYTVTFVNEDGETPIGEAAEYDYGTAWADVAKPDAPEKTGYTFKEWAGAPEAVTENVTVKASYTINKYTVTFVEEDGETPIGEAAEYAYGTAWADVTKPDAPEKTGYTFKEWAGAPEAVTENVTVKASYTINKYTVTFVEEDGETPIGEAAEYDYGTAWADVAKPDAPEKTGYTFKEWAGAPEAVTENVTVKASYTINKYTVTFVEEDGETPIGEAAEYAYGTAWADVDKPDAPGKTGYTFKEWAGAPEAVTENVTVTASYQAHTYTVAFDKNDSDAAGTMAAQSFTYDVEQALTANDFTKENYTFAGWAESAEGDVVYTDMEAVKNLTSEDNGEITLYAVWAENEQITVTFNKNDGSAEPETATQTMYKGLATALNANEFTRTGYTFEGWATSELGGAVYADKEKVSLENDTTLYAKWKVNQYTITFDTAGGSEIDAITQDYGTAVTAPENPTKEGYTFDGWDKAIPAKMPAENITITAKWKVNQYTITFDTAGGSEIDAITQDYDTAVTAPENPTREGYTFDGWDKAIPEKMPAGDLTITAKWKVNQYTITFDTAGGSEIDAITQDYGTAVTAPENPTKEGYTFDGWDKAIPAKMPAEDLTIKAKWTANTYTVKFDKNDSDAAGTMADQSFTYDVEQALAENGFTKENYTFAGWATSADGAVVYTDKAEVRNLTAENNGEVTLYAVWTQNPQVTVTFNKNDGSTEPETVTQTIYQNVETELSANEFTREGYTFEGWATSVDGDAVYADQGEVTLGTDTILYAKWTVNQYTITFDTAGGSEIDAITQDYDTAVTAPENPTKEGYTFDGWDKAIPAKMPAENITITAKWKVNQYTITFDTAGGSEIDAITQDYDTAVTAPENPTREGYTFDGWDKAIPEKMPAGDLTITAKWKVNQYTITFDTAGGSEIDAITQDYDTAVAAPEDPTKEGYTFDGWDKAIPGKMPAENLTITAKWTANSYTVKFDKNDSDATGTMTDQNFTFDVEQALTENGFTKENYTFAGWATSADGAVVYADKAEVKNLTAENNGVISLYAVWTEKPVCEHEWGKAKYYWASDNSEVKAFHTCNICELTEEETVDVTSKTTAPTCTAAGKITYTSAEFENEAFEVQTKTAASGKAALGHKYGEYKLTRAAGTSKSGILTKTCSRNTSHKSTMVVNPVIAKVIVNSNTKATISWSKVKGAERYLVYFTKCNSSFSSSKSTKNLSYVKTGLKKGANYKFKVVAQRKINGKWTNIASGYSGHFVSGNLSTNKKYTNQKSISVKKAAVTLKVGKTSTIKPSNKLVKSGKKVMISGHAAQYRYLTNNSDIATVNSSGKITAKKAGTCTVYVVGINGVSKGVKVTVTK